MLRPINWVLLIAAADASDATNCKVGFAYKGRGDPTSRNVNSFDLCQSSCQNFGDCAQFTYDYKTKECWLLDKATHDSELEPEVSSVSGTELCQMPRLSPSQETESETSHRIHGMLATIAANVAKRSKDPIVVGLAQHLEYVARNGYLAEESYDNLVAVLNAGIDDMDSGSINRLTSYGHRIPTRDDLNWLVTHMTGETPPNEDAEYYHINSTNRTDGKQACKGRACDQSSGSGSLSAGETWTNAEVRYCFDQYIASSARSAVECAIGKIRSELPGIHFTNVGYAGSDTCNVKPAIFVQSSDSGCYSNIGMQTPHIFSFFGLSGNQKLNLQVPGCNDCGTAIHEMLHSMGMAHEQARPDRDTYVQIHWDHIKTSSFSQFTINHNADTNRDYDICSIMHYGKLAFSNDGEATISVKDAGYQVYTSDPTRYQFYVIGQRTMMTKYDLAQLAQMYQCSSRSCCGCQQEISEEIQVDHPGQENRHGIAQEFFPGGSEGVVAVIVGGTIVITLSVALFCCFCNGKGGAPEDSRTLLGAEGF